MKFLNEILHFISNFSYATKNAYFDFKLCFRSLFFLKRHFLLFVTGQDSNKFLLNVWSFLRVWSTYLFFIFLYMYFNLIEMDCYNFFAFLCIKNYILKHQFIFFENRKWLLILEHITTTKFCTLFFYIKAVNFNFCQLKSFLIFKYE